MKFILPAVTFSALLQPSFSLEANLRRNLKKWDETCTGIVQHTQYAQGSSNTGKDLELVCETASGDMYTVDVPPGWIKQMMRDGELTSGATELVIPNGSTFDETTKKINAKTPPGLAKRKIPPGQFAKKTPPGQGNGNGNNNGNGNGNGNGKNKSRNLNAIEGNKSLLVVRVIASDASTTASQEELADSVFGNAGDAVNLKSQYSDCSHGRLNFVEADTRTGATTNISGGAVTVTLDTFTAEQDTVMRNAITTKLNAEFGVTSPTQLADHVMYCLPPGSMGGIAYAFINSWMSVYSDNWCTYLSAQVHEIGHNLGLAHSNEGGPYKDQSGMMGFSYSQDDGPKMCFNAAKSWQLGWYDARQYTVTNGAPTATSSLAYIGKLAGIVDYSDGANTPVLIKLNTPGTTDYYINFNAQHGFNSQTKEGGNQVTITRAGGEGNSYAESELLAKLSAGGTYNLVDFGASGETLSVEIISIDTVAREADVRVCLGTCPDMNMCTANSDCADSDPCTEDICNAGECSNTFSETLCPVCPSGEKPLDVTILTDNYPGETTWSVVNECTGETVVSGGAYSTRMTTYSTGEICVPDGDYTFTINDAYGDGICCAWGVGSFSIKYAGEDVATGGAFGSSQTVKFGSDCAEGGPCPGGQKPLDVTILTDNYPGETTWSVVNQCNGATVASGGPYASRGTEYATGKICVPDSDYKFTINDSYGDGVCCSYGAGAFSVDYDGQKVGEGGVFGRSATSDFGGSC